MRTSGRSGSTDRRLERLGLESQKNEQNKEFMSESRFIVIEGPIGVGKTSLARRLSESLDSELLLEQAEANPFLERFYRNRAFGSLARPAVLPVSARTPGRGAAAGGYFQRRTGRRFSDRERIACSRKINLDRHELELYDRVYDSVTVEPPVARPRGVPAGARRYAVVSHCAPRHRLRAAHRTPLPGAAERGLCAGFFHDYDASPLLIVNAATIDPINNEQHYGVLLDEIRRVQSGRHFFNPVVLRDG